MGTLRKWISHGLAASLAVFIVACDDEGGVGAGIGPEAGACYDSNSRDYTENGPYGYDIERVAGYEVYVPRATADCNQFPVVGFAMGTGTPPSNYRAYYRHMASWGMVVVIDPANLINLGGSSLEDAIQDVQRDRTLGSSLTEVGLIGHSQGGAAVVNVALGNDLDVTAIVGLMPALFTGGGRIDAAGLYIGGTTDLFGAATDPQRPYDNTSGPAFIADMQGQGHMVGSGRGSEASILAMSTAWFRCHLGKDSNACGLFERSSVRSCAFSGRWAKCGGKNL